MAPREIGARSQEALARIADTPGLVRELAEVALRSTDAGESYPYMDKLVLWRSADGSVRLRLHLFRPGYTDRPHNHRWSFASRILAGGYIHTLYGTADQVLADTRAGAPLRQLWVGTQPQSSSYFLDDQAVHSLRAEHATVSLVLRGPSVKERYFTLLPAAGSATGEMRLTWSGGAANESADELLAKRLTIVGAKRIRAALEAL